MGLNRRRSAGASVEASAANAGRAARSRARAAIGATAMLARGDAAPRKGTATRRIVGALRRLPHATVHQVRRARRAGTGFLMVFLDGRWWNCAYETCWSAVTVAVGKVTTCARRIDGLPPRFEALLLAQRLARQNAR